MTLYLITIQYVATFSEDVDHELDGEGLMDGDPLIQDGMLCIHKYTYITAYILYST